MGFTQHCKLGKTSCPAGFRGLTWPVTKPRKGPLASELAGGDWPALGCCWSLKPPGRPSNGGRRGEPLDLGRPHPKSRKGRRGERGGATFQIEQDLLPGSGAGRAKATDSIPALPPPSRSLSRTQGLGLRQYLFKFLLLDVQNCLNPLHHLSKVFTLGRAGPQV